MIDRATGFQDGNKQWMLRHKHGRTGRFTSPDELVAAAESYFEWVDANPWMRVESLNHPVVQGSTLIYTAQLPATRPYTLTGLCLYWQVNQTYWRQLKRSKQGDEAFTQAIQRIEDIIYVQKFEGAVVGDFNANIIARDLNLNSKQEGLTTTNVIVRRERLNSNIVIEGLPN